MECKTIYTTSDCMDLIQLLTEKKLFNQIKFYKIENKKIIKIHKKKEEEVLQIIAEWFTLRFGNKFLCDALKKNFFWLSSEEYTVISNLALRRFMLSKDLLSYTIFTQMKEFTEFTRFVNLDGFLLFATRDLRRSIDRFIETALEEMEVHEEYRSFIEFIGYYITSEPAKINHLTVVATPECRYEFFDYNNVNITEQCAKLFHEEFEEKDDEKAEEQDDMLFSLLILMVPKSITMYGTMYIKNKNLIQTLNEIFQSRICCFELIPEYYANYHL